MSKSLRRSGTLLSALFVAASLLLAPSAAAASNTITLTAGPVAVPNVPVSACVNSTCVSTPVVSTVTLTASATTDIGSPIATLDKTNCPSGQVGAAITVTVTVKASVTISGKVVGTTPNGPVTVNVGPKTVTVAPGPHGATVSACAN